MDSTNVDPATVWSLMAPFFVGFLIVAVFLIACNWRIFTKAGKPGWAAIVPFYNLYVLMQIIGKPWWWMLVIFAGAIPTVGWVITSAFYLVVALELARKFGKSNAFGIFGLWLFSIVGYPMLAFGSATYDANAAPVVTFLSGEPKVPAEPVQ